MRQASAPRRASLTREACLLAFWLLDVDDSSTLPLKTLVEHDRARGVALEWSRRIELRARSMLSLVSIVKHAFRVGHGLKI